MEPPDEKAKLRLAAQKRVMEAAYQQFRSTRNPLFAWEAYCRCRHDALPLPEWVLVYFDENGRRLGALVQKSRSGKLAGDHRAEVIAAFGMNVEGRGNIFARFAGIWLDDWDWIATGEMVAALVRQGAMIKVAIGKVADALAAEYSVPLEIQSFEGIPATGRWMLRIKDDQPPSVDDVTRAWRRYKTAYPSQAAKPRRKAIN